MNFNEKMNGLSPSDSMNHARFAPLIKAVLSPSLENIDGLKELSTQEIVKYITKFMPDEILLGLLMKNEKGHYGFVINPRIFGFSAATKSTQRPAEVMNALLSRFAEVRKNRSDWETYAGQLRNSG